MATVSKLIINWKKEKDINTHTCIVTHTYQRPAHNLQTDSQTHTSCNPCLLACCCFSPSFLGGLNAWAYLNSRWGGTAGVPLCNTSSASGDGCWSLMYAGTQKESHLHWGKKGQNGFSDSSLVSFGCLCGGLQEPKSCRLNFYFVLNLIWWLKVLMDPQERVFSSCGKWKYFFHT